MTFGDDAPPPGQQEHGVLAPPPRLARRVLVAAAPAPVAPPPASPAPEPAPPTPLPPAPPEPALPVRRWRDRVGTEGALLIGLAVLALLPRLACLDCNSLWRDEIATLEGLRGGLAAVAGSNVPLYSFQVWLATQLADPATTAVWLRLPSALAGALTPLIIYALGRLWWGRAQGLLAALLTALAPVLLVYAQDMRAYTELTLLTAAAVYSLAHADRTGAGRWLLLAGALLGADVLMARTVLVMVLPALAPYALWVGARWWVRRGRHTRSGRIAGAALLGAGVLGLGLILWQRDRLLSYITPFTLPTLSPAALGQFNQMVKQQLDFDIPAAFEGPLTGWAQAALLGLIGVGAGCGLWRRGHRQGVLVCGLLTVVPLIIFTLSSTTNIIYPRFALFALPFGFLLAAHGLVAPLQALRGAAPAPRRNQVVGGAGVGLTALLLLPLVAGVGAYYTPDGNTQLAYRPDYRSVVQYINARVKPNDLVLFLGWDDRVADYYWHGQPPVGSYSALDPRIYRHQGAGSVYWVMSYDYNKPNQFIDSRKWGDVLSVERIVVLREDSPNIEMHQIMTDFTERMFANDVSDPVLARAAPIMRGSYFEARGLITEAVQTYRTVGSDEPTRAFGREWLQVAVDNAAAGQLRPAWRAALMAQYHQPDAAPIYRWIAAQLAATGQPLESGWAAAVADMLEQR